MINRLLSTPVTLLLLMSLLLMSAASAEVIEEQRSLYQKVFMVEENGMRCMRFKKRSTRNFSQSCIYLADRELFVFDYYKQAMAATFFVKQPAEILVIGLGGGVLAGTFGELFPQANITSVEIDPVVVKMAHKYFDYSDEADNITTVVQDGRVFVKRALKKGRRFDLVILDAFSSDYIPEHMLTREFLEEVKTVLADHGLLVANTFSASKLFNHESTTYQAVFGEFYQVRFTGMDVSRVIIASNQKLPDISSLLPRVNQVRGMLQPLGVDALSLYSSISSEVNWDIKARILTDQYSPANLLNSGSR
ncbi:MAG: fused MFS/spermidine synthase [Proteobacteria bacterium]|nr:fused MFS/spermidine synthase [Pseudomonadota bacterium]